jgi:hypothetical protein
MARERSELDLVSGRDLDAPLAEHAPPGECFTRHARSS